MKKRIKIFLLLLAILVVAVPLKVLKAENEDANGINNITKTIAVVPASGIKHNLNGAVVLFVGSSQALVNNTEKQVDSESEDIKPVIKNDRTLVPVRFISENFGAKVDWNANDKTVYILVGAKKVEMAIGRESMMLDGKSVSLDAAPEVIGNRTFIPLRKLAEALGKEVLYDRGLIIVGSKENLYNTASEKGELDKIIARVNNLPVVGSYEKLKSIVGANNSVIRNSYDMKEKAVTGASEQNSADMAPIAPSQVVSNSAKLDDSKDFSTTNVQVQGVDEADIVKTDGEYIYQVNRGKIVIAKAYPAENMEVVNTLGFSDENAVPVEMYIDKKYMTVIASATNSLKIDQAQNIKSSYYNPIAESTKAIVYDISDRKNLKKVREFELEGNYISSRKIGSSLYMITNKYVYLNNEDKNIKITPSYNDTAVKGGKVDISYSQIRYFPHSSGNNYMIIGGINLDNINEPAKVNTYLGAGQNIYASTENLYVSINNFNYNIYTAANIDVMPVVTNSTSTTNLPILSGSASNSSAKAGSTSSVAPNTATSPKIAPSIRPAGNSNGSTKIYKFSLNNGQITYINEGDVPGTILNQFSMDENGKYFRIATTTGNTWDNTSQNNLYILDELLNTKGKIENIAPGEKIYSTRFMGDRCYMVTFKKVDPFFVIDLKDPASPKVLGALKIPGYSDYLHPYDENHIIGFGKDTEEYGSSAYYQGMKIALFDVTDVTKPVQMFSQIIGDRGTDSELLSNHKALLFSKEKNLLAFPVNELKIDNKDTSNLGKITEYGKAYFQGAYVYNIDLEKGFTLKGKITHMTKEDVLKSGEYQFDYDKSVKRVLYIGDTIYTLSNNMIKANSLKDMTENKAINININ
ncbi:MAG: beta-propeller domain-containing protein [Bacillota bacterium]|nr:beta-propeller domain-containing protein [Bacillota bacterium]